MSTVKISIKINCEIFESTVDDISPFLREVCDKHGNRGRGNAERILRKLEQGEALCERDMEDLRELCFLYDESIREKMIAKGHWRIIGSLEEAKGKEKYYRERAESYGEYRYPIDNGWLGAYAEDKVKTYFREDLRVSFKEWEPEDSETSRAWQDKVDRFDIKISNRTIDVKCATEPHYVEITPKVVVENEFPKDVYIATKFFEDGMLYLIGFFQHKDITSYETKRLYGTEYYAVKIYDARCIDELLNDLNGSWDGA